MGIRWIVPASGAALGLLIHMSAGAQPAPPLPTPTASPECMKACLSKGANTIKRACSGVAASCEGSDEAKRACQQSNLDAQVKCQSTRMDVDTQCLQACSAPAGGEGQ